MATLERTPLYGIAAEFDSGEALLAAVNKAKAEGYDRIEAYSPYEIEGMSETLNRSTPWLAWLVFAALLIGAVIGFTFQYITDWVYALNIGGRPFIAWQAYSVITFEFGILLAGLATLGGFLLKTGLPLPYHPIFNAEGIEKASSSHYFICIRADDPKFNINRTPDFLQGLGAANVSEVSQ